MSVPVVSFLSTAHCCGWSAPCVQRQNSCSNKTHTPPTSLSLLRPPFASFNSFNPPMSLSVPPPATFSLFKLLFTPCISSVSHLLSYFLTLYTLILVSFTNSLHCPPPSLLIRAICWRGRQRELQGWTRLCCM